MVGPMISISTFQMEARFDPLSRERQRFKKRFVKEWVGVGDEIST